jgi:hypothetical protein
LISIPALTSILTENTSVKALPKVVFEYNMNEMAGSIEVTTASSQPGAIFLLKEAHPLPLIIKTKVVLQHNQF